jgi:BRCT domain type II-containing protein
MYYVYILKQEDAEGCGGASAADAAYRKLEEEVERIESERERERDRERER